MDGTEHDSQLWNFGESQYVQYLCTGELLRVYGAQPDIPGGPFGQIAVHDGETLLLGTRGTDQTRTIQSLDKYRRVFIEAKRRDGFHVPQEIFVIKSKDAETAPSEVWGNVARLQWTPKVLEIIVSETERYKSEFYWQHIAMQCGAQPVKLWMSLRWFMTFLTGYRQLNRKVDRWRSILENATMSPEHIRDSCRSKKRKRVGDDPDGDDEVMLATPDFSISVPGAVVVLLKMLHDRRLRKAPAVGEDPVNAERVHGLLSAFLNVVLEKRALDFHGILDIRVVNGIVDDKAWLESQAIFGVPPRSRTVLNVQAAL